MKKILKITGISIGSILLVAVLGLGIIFSGEIRTLLTFKQLNDQPFYEMTYHADYGLDEFLEQGAATDDELVSFVTKKILKGVSFEVNPDGACSTFIATTPEGDDLFGRNFDYVPSIGLIVRTTPKNGYESLSVVNLNHLGLSQENMPTKNLLNRIITLAAPYAPLDGMNEKGLSIGVLVINKGIVHQSTGKVPITTTSAIRMILDKAATVDEAIALLEKYGEVLPQVSAFSPDPDGILSDEEYEKALVDRIKEYGKDGRYVMWYREKNQERYLKGQEIIYRESRKFYCGE